MVPVAQSRSRVSTSSIGSPGAPLHLAALLYIGLIPLDSLAVFPGRSLTAFAGAALISLWLLALVLGANRLPFGIAQRPTGIYVASAAFVIWTFLQLAWSIDVPNSQTGVVSYLALALSIPALSRGIQGRSYILPLVVYSLSATLASVVMLVGGRDPSNLEARATAFGNNPNVLSLILVVGVAFSLLLAAELRSWRRVGIAIAGLLCAGGSLVAGSKTGLVALIATFLVVMLIVLRRLPGRQLVAVYFLASVSAAILWSLRSRLPQRLGETAESLRSGDLTNRQYIWQAAFDNVGDWMPFGVGVDNAAEYMSWIYAPLVLHNVFLELAVELGVVGLGLGLAFYAAVLVGGRFSPFWIYVLAGMVPLLVFGFTTSLFYFKIQWMLAGLAAVRSPTAIGADSRTRSISRPSPGVSRWRV